MMRYRYGPWDPAYYALLGPAAQGPSWAYANASLLNDPSTGSNGDCAASISYITPFEPSCLLVYGPGKYRFRDFLIAGAPLSLLLLGVLMLLAPLLWPLR